MEMVVCFIVLSRYTFIGMYAAIRPIIPKLKARNVKYFHIYCVDNILCRVADPHLIGCAIDMDADCAATVK